MIIAECGSGILVEQEVEEAKRATLERGLKWWGGSWGRLKMVDNHPNATMEFVADALGCGYGKAQEERVREGELRKGKGKGSGKGKGYGKGVRYGHGKAQEEIGRKGGEKGTGKGCDEGVSSAALYGC